MTALRHAEHVLEVHCADAGVADVTPEVRQWLQQIGATCGLATLQLRQASATLTIREDADPIAVRAASRPALTLSVPIVDGQLALGPHQAIVLAEHRTRNQARTILLSYVGA
jgi:thiamine phosphate synthase YjbQ (UPF0047 family)